MDSDGMPKSKPLTLADVLSVGSSLTDKLKTIGEDPELMAELLHSFGLARDMWRFSESKKKKRSSQQ